MWSSWTILIRLLKAAACKDVSPSSFLAFILAPLARYFFTAPMSPIRAELINPESFSDSWLGSFCNEEKINTPRGDAKIHKVPNRLIEKILGMSLDREEISKSIKKIF